MLELFSILGGGEQKKLQTEYLNLRGKGLELEHVPYSRQVGIVWRVSENPLITGFDTPVINCCVLVVLGKERGGMMHISPNTLPDDYTISTGERHRVFNRDVDKQYLKMMSQLGEKPRKIVIVGGDNGLSSELKKLVSGKDSAWGKLKEQGEEVTVEKIDLGTYGKEVIVDSHGGTVYVAEHNLKKFADGRTIVKV